MANKAKSAAPKQFVTSDSLVAERLQKKLGKNPAVTGNKLTEDRKYTFAISEEKAKEILDS